MNLAREITRYEHILRGRDFRKNHVKGELGEAVVELAIRLLCGHILHRDNRQSASPDFGALFFMKHRRLGPVYIEVHNFNRYPISVYIAHKNTVTKFKRVPPGSLKIVVGSVGYTEPAREELKANGIIHIPFPRQVLGREDYYEAIKWVSEFLQELLWNQWNEQMWRETMEAQFGGHTDGATTVTAIITITTKHSNSKSSFSDRLNPRELSEPPPHLLDLADACY